MSRTRKVLAGLAPLLVLAAAAAVFAIGPRNLIGMWRYDQRREGTLAIGDFAPRVAVVKADGSSPAMLPPLPASRPLVLIFGSFT